MQTRNLIWRYTSKTTIIRHLICARHKSTTNVEVASLTSPAKALLFSCGGVQSLLPTLPASDETTLCSRRALQPSYSSPVTSGYRLGEAMQKQPAERMSVQNFSLTCQRYSRPKAAVAKERTTIAHRPVRLPSPSRRRHKSRAQCKREDLAEEKIIG